MADERHVGIATIRRYFEEGSPGAFTLGGSADVELFIDPSQRIIGFRTAAGDLTPDLARFDFITFRTVLVGESRVDELSIRAPLGGVEEAYSWMCAVIDRVQHDQVSAGAAVLSSLAALEGVLAKQVALSREKLIGLFGEIFFLVTLIEELGASRALDSWFGGDSEEHDFRLPVRDVEVKVTSTERRRHWISSMRQLQASGDRELAVLSIQLTAAPAGVGLSLPELVARCTCRLADETLKKRFADILAQVGYRDEHAALYAERWSLRSEPALYLVDARFPAVRAAELERCVAQAERIVDLRYQVDLEGLVPIPCEHSFAPLEQA